MKQENVRFISLAAVAAISQRGFLPDSSASLFNHGDQQPWQSGRLDNCPW